MFPANEHHRLAHQLRPNPRTTATNSHEQTPTPPRAETSLPTPTRNIWVSAPTNLSRRVVAPATVTPMTGHTRWGRGPVPATTSHARAAIRRPRPAARAHARSRSPGGRPQEIPLTASVAQVAGTAIVHLPLGGTAPAREQPVQGETGTRSGPRKERPAQGVPLVGSGRRKERPTQGAQLVGSTPSDVEIGDRDMQLGEGSSSAAPNLISQRTPRVSPTQPG